MRNDHALSQFARYCKAATRAVSLYPGTHPAIEMALSRVTSSARHLTSHGEVTLTVFPDSLTAGGEAPARPDPLIAELAALLHERLVGELRMQPDSDAEDWRALLLILARPPEDVIASGGIGKAWAATQRTRFEIREIDYAEVLRERAGGGSADWDRIIAYCLQGQSPSLDERALAALFEVPGDPTRFAALLERIERGPSARGASMTARAAALLRLVRAAVAAVGNRGASEEQALQTVAEASARLTPDMLLALLAERQSADPAQAQLASRVIERMGNETIATFVATSVVAERAATDRLAYAFQALVPDVPRREPLLQLAHDEAKTTELGADPQFETLWHNAAQMLTSYSDEAFVSEAYARELSGARTQAIEVDRVSDDPPERLQGWLFSVSEEAVRQLDLDLLLDLTRIERGPHEWTAIAMIVVAEVERRTLLGDTGGARQLAESLVRELAPDGQGLAAAAEAVLYALASGPLVHHVVLHLRKTEAAADVDRVTGLCHAIGPRLARPMAEALAVEEHPRAIRHLRELLLSFGAAGRQSVEQLKGSSNPAVRRTAIDLLRAFGGREALPELASMLDDADPQVQRESISAIVQIGTTEAYAILERALVATGAPRDHLVQQLIGLRDVKAIPPLCYVLNRTRPRGPLVQVHLDIIGAVGSLGAHREAIRALEAVLHRGEWWAPRRTAAQRHAAAASLRRIGSPDAIAILDRAAIHGGRGVRHAVFAHSGGRRERARS
jgi:uncharacterized tellurite resistance protein B-like protein